MVGSATGSDLRALGGRRGTTLLISAWLTPWNGSRSCPPARPGSYRDGDHVRPGAPDRSRAAGVLLCPGAGALSDQPDSPGAELA